MNMQLDFIVAVIMSPYKHSKNAIVTLYLFAGILK